MDSIGKKRVRQSKPFFPDEIITNILIRVPVKCAMRCRLVCRRWRDLMLARDFVELHTRKSIPTIFSAKYWIYSDLELFALDKWWELARTRFIIHRFPFYSQISKETRVLFSQAGLIGLNSSETKFVILNPVRPEYVRITIDETNLKIFGVYYHPSMKEYCSLLRIGTHTLDSIQRQHQYMVLNLGYNPSLKTISYPFSNKVEKRDAKPLFINSCLYWMLDKYDGHNDIMKFDIISEEFTIIPCPVPWNTECMHYQTHLLNIDGFLSFLLVFPKKITIWRLEDPEENFWAIVCDLSICPSGICEEIVPLELDGRLLRCNLNEGTTKNYPKKKYGDGVGFLPRYRSVFLPIFLCLDSSNYEELKNSP